MKTRQHYYDNGLDKLELDVDQVEASLLRKMMDDEGPAAENDSGPQDTNAASKTGRERAVNLDPGSVDVDYDYENQVSAIAKSLHPVAPRLQRRTCLLTCPAICAASSLASYPDRTWTLKRSLLAP